MKQSLGTQYQEKILTWIYKTLLYPLKGFIFVWDVFFTLLDILQVKMWLKLRSWETDLHIKIEKPNNILKLEDYDNFEDIT